MAFKEVSQNEKNMLFGKKKTEMNCNHIARGMKSVRVVSDTSFSLTFS